VTPAAWAAQHGIDACIYALDLGFGRGNPLRPSSGCEQHAGSVAILQRISDG
jgi:hypothetical protein